MANSFDGAVGYGAAATGGRGGQVVKVTNGNDSGEGSLRWALEEVAGPRIVIFDGVNDIELSDNINIRDGDVTIAGQTAGGVQVHGAGLSIRADNVIMRGMMLRDAYDPLKIIDANDVMIDHNSFEWGVDENVSITASKSSAANITLSNNIIAEGLHDAGHSKGPHSMGLLVRNANDETDGVQNLTVHSNLFAYNNRRNPWIQDGAEVELTNNFVYGAGDQDEAFHLSSDVSANVVNNYMQSGPESGASDESHFLLRGPNSVFYLSGNVEADADGNVVTGRTANGDAVDSIVDTPVFDGSGIEVIDADAVRAHVLANAGAFPGGRDATDQRIIDQITRGEGGLVNETQFAPLNAPIDETDSDGDGMPDWFEQAAGLNNTVDDSGGDGDGDGYTNVEEYINGLIDGFDMDSGTPPRVAEPPPIGDDEVPPSVQPPGDVIPPTPGDNDGGNGNPIVGGDDSTPPRIAEPPPIGDDEVPPSVEPPGAAEPPAPIAGGGNDENPVTAADSILQRLFTPSADNPAAAAATVGADLMLGTTADDDFAGSWGDDRLAGDDGNDAISGGHGDDLIDGGDGSEFLTGDFGDDIILGRGGEDELRGHRGDDVLTGGDEDDRLYGGAGDDVHFGGGGEDLVDGGRGVDVAVFEGAATDYMTRQIDGGVVFTHANGEADLVVNVEHVHFAGSGETFGLSEGQLVATEDTDHVADLLEGDLLGELLGTAMEPAAFGDTSTKTEAGAPLAPQPNADAQLSEMVELGELRAAAGNGVDEPTANPRAEGGGDLFTGEGAGAAPASPDMPGDDLFRVA